MFCSKHCVFLVGHKKHNFLIMGGPDGFGRSSERNRQQHQKDNVISGATPTSFGIDMNSPMETPSPRDLVQGLHCHFKSHLILLAPTIHLI